MHSPSSFHDIAGYGAVGDGQAINTVAINRAIRTCSENGGGTVHIPPGYFVTGTIRLLSHVHLHLEAGAVLEGSRNKEDYIIEGEKFGLIMADSECDLSISGPGTISGQANHFMRMDRPHEARDYDKNRTRQGLTYMTAPGAYADGPVSFDWRPNMMLVFLRCENVTLRDVTLRDAPDFTVRFNSCENVRVSGVTIRNDRRVPNNDGVHLSRSKNVRISDCDIIAGDDAIALTVLPDEYGFPGVLEKSAGKKARYGNKSGHTENVVVSNCVLSSRSAGIRVGYDGESRIRNCLFQNCVIYDSNRGIGVFARGSGSVENCIFSNMTITTRLHSGHWWGRGEAIHVSALRLDESKPGGGIRNLVFDQIIAQSEMGIVLYGTPESGLEDVRLRNVQLKIVNGDKSTTVGGNYDLRPSSNMATSVFQHDSPGIYARHARNLLLENIQLKWGGDLPPYFTHGIQCEFCSEVKIRNCEGGPAPGCSDGEAVKISSSV